MKSHSRKSRRSSYQAIAAIAASAVGAVFMTGEALAVTANSFDYTAPKTGFYSVSNLGLAPEDSAATYTNPPGGLATTGSGSCFSTTVNLPNGATIKSVIVYLAAVDEDDVTVTLMRQRLTSGAENFIGQKTFEEVPLNGQRQSGTVPINPALAVVNKQLFNYAFRVCVDPGGVFYGARINYTYTNAGD